MTVTFDDWVGGRSINTLGSNVGASALAFQNWRRFKEAFAPELVRRAAFECERSVEHCLDPFSGSGTTALACQFLGIRPTAIEVNPYLADLAEAKLSSYDTGSLLRDLKELRVSLSQRSPDPAEFFGSAPKTFVEPGANGRWIFEYEVAKRLVAYIESLDDIKSEINRRLFRVIIGGILIEASNVVVSGKGRRYRQGWEKQRRTARDLDILFDTAIESAIVDIFANNCRAELRYSIIRGDARQIVSETQDVDLVVTSPPYPNSFDYTDVYNVELWSLGYLRSSSCNSKLRLSTLSSHVQIYRNFAEAPAGSGLLDGVIAALDVKRKVLWDPNIPAMIGSYFSDLILIILTTLRNMRNNGEIWIVIGDSRYSDVTIPTAKVIAELLMHSGAEIVREEPFRSMRASAQQGGRAELSETLLVIRK